MKGYFEGNCFQLDKGRRVTLKYSSKEMGFLNPNFPFFGESGGSV